MAAHQGPQSLGFSRQEHWSGLPFPSPMHESETWKWLISNNSTTDIYSLSQHTSQHYQHSPPESCICFNWYKLMFSFHFLNAVFCTAEVFFILMKSSYHLFFSWIVPLVLYVKLHHYNQGHLGLLPCYFLGVLSLCLLSFWVNFCEGCNIFV